MCEYDKRGDIEVQVSEKQIPSDYLEKPTANNMTDFQMSTDSGASHVLTGAFQRLSGLISLDKFNSRMAKAIELVAEAAGNSCSPNTW